MQDYRNNVCRYKLLTRYHPYIYAPINQLLSPFLQILLYVCQNGVSIVFVTRFSKINQFWKWFYIAIHFFSGKYLLALNISSKFEYKL